MNDVVHLPSSYLVHASDYDFIKDISEGGYGSVKLVKEKKTGKKYAQKIIPFVEGDELGAPLYFFREFLSLFDSQVPGLPFLKLKGFNFPTKDDPAFIITEYIEGGSLESLIEDGFEGCDDVDTTKMKIIFGIAFAIKFLHSSNIVHRDLKPANVLLDNHREVHLADFGFARQISANETITGGLGTPEYMAPELFDEDFTKADKSIDIYSFAVMVLEIIAGCLKINGKNAHTLMNDHVTEGKRYDIPNSVPKPFEDMIRDCWDGNPSKRWPIDDIVDSLSDGSLTLPRCNNNVFNEYVERLTKIFNQYTSQKEEPECKTNTQPYSF